MIKKRRRIKLESAASTESFSYSAAVVPIPLYARTLAALGLLVCTACASLSSRPEVDGSTTFYTVTAEIALSRHQARVAALEYAAAAGTDRDVGLLRRATEVTAACLQPSLTAAVAERWLEVDPTELDAHRAAARAALELHQIDQATAHYRTVLMVSPRGAEAEFTALDAELAASGNVYGARQVADRLSAYFPASPAALRLQAFTALRADDPAAAVRAFEAALAAEPAAAEPAAAEPAVSAPPAVAPPAAVELGDLTQGLWRARILAGDVDAPLAQAKAAVERDATAANELDYALVLLAARRNAAARDQLVSLTREADARPVAVRLLGLMDFQDGHLEDASMRFAELVNTGRFADDALYYLGMIAERHHDPVRALHLYAKVQSGENAVPALLRAASILRANGAAPAAEELLDQLVLDEPQRAPEILAARARIYADAGDAAHAMAVLDQGAVEYPDSVELRYARASVSEEQGHVDAALQELKAVEALRPADPAALNAYGYTLADHRLSLRFARKLIEQAYAAAPSNAAILDSLGWVLFRQGHGEQALPYLNAAYAEIRDGDVAAHLGEVYWQLGRRAEAERVWSEAQRAGGDNHLLDATRLRLHASN